MPSARERADERARDRERLAAGSAKLLGTRSGQALAGSVGLIFLLTLVGLVALWPAAGESRVAGAGQAFGGPTRGATVERSAVARCAGPVAQACRTVTLRVDGGGRATLDLGPTAATAPVAAGARVRVQGTGGALSYAGPDRRGTLLWLTGAFALLVITLTRWRGVLALLGLGMSLVLITRFIVPALLAGRPALLVALVGALAVMFVTVLLTYGVNAPSLAACLGIASSLLFGALAGVVVVHAASLDGRTGELAQFFASTASVNPVSLQGVVIAGLVIGVLGVLADMGVTQASAVMALRRANPGLRARGLFRGAFGVGRDHLVATTHTLVLAYAGATLPVLLLLHASGVGITDAVNTQDLAEPVVATLVGAMALLLSVPLTTALCAAVVARIPPQALPGHGHAH